MLQFYIIYMSAFRTFKRHVTTFFLSVSCSVVDLDLEPVEPKLFCGDGAVISNFVFEMK